MGRTDGGATLNYQADMAINEHRLDRECLKQPTLFMKYALLAAEAERAVKKAEEREKLVRSELVLKAANGNAKGLEKATAQTIEAWFRTQPEHIHAKKELAEAEFERDVLSSAIAAMKMRKDMLQELVRLHLANYFSSPSVEMDTEDAAEHLQENVAREQERRQNARGGKK